MRGIILAGGYGTRLYPATKVLSKQLLPVYDKPMIYYPLSVLMLAGIKDILIISTPQDTPMFEQLLGDGSNWGIKLQYKIQPSPNGLAEAFILGEEFIGTDNVCLILGDNIFYGQGFTPLLKKSFSLNEGAIIYSCQVSDPKRFGIVDFDENLKVKSIEEKPTNPKSNNAVTGIYFYDKTAGERARNLTSSDRGELEITDLNKSYLNDNLLCYSELDSNYAWFDTGNPDDLFAASMYVKSIQDRTQTMIGCIEGEAYKQGFITRDEFRGIKNSMPSCSYQTNVVMSYFLD